MQNAKCHHVQLDLHLKKQNSKMQKCKKIVKNVQLDLHLKIKIPKAVSSFKGCWYKWFQDNLSCFQARSAFYFYFPRANLPERKLNWKISKNHNYPTIIYKIICIFELKQLWWWFHQLLDKICWPCELNDNQTYR